MNINIDSQQSQVEKDSIIVLIPCYQEADSIGNVAGEAIRLGFETVVIDDGSTDATSEVARQAGAEVIREEKNAGKGMVVNIGLRHALDRGCSAVVLLDGDGQHLPAEIVHLVDVFRSTKADLIIGTRMKNTEDMPFVRRQTNRLMSALLSRMVGQPISDTQCGFRLIARRAIPDALNCTSGGFSAESEMILQFALRGYRIEEAPVSTVYGNEKSKIRPVRDTWKFIRMLLRFHRQKRLCRVSGCIPGKGD